MHTTVQILDALSARLGGVSDYRIAKVLNTSSTATVTAWRKGRNFIGQDYALKIAHLLQWEPAYVMACCEAERAARDERLENTGEIVATWRAVAARFQPIAGIVLLVFLSLFAHQTLEASPWVSGDSYGGLQVDDVYIMCTSLALAARLMCFAIWPFQTAAGDATAVTESAWVWAPIYHNVTYTILGA